MIQVLAIGECMIKMSDGRDGNRRTGFAGDALNTLWYTRAVLDPADGPVAYFTALGDDRSRTGLSHVESQSKCAGFTVQMQHLG